MEPQQTAAASPPGSARVLPGPPRNRKVKRSAAAPVGWLLSEGPGVPQGSLLWDGALQLLLLVEAVGKRGPACGRVCLVPAW